MKNLKAEIVKASPGANIGDKYTLIEFSAVIDGDGRNNVIAIGVNEFTGHINWFFLDSIKIVSWDQ